MAVQPCGELKSSDQGLGAFNGRLSGRTGRISYREGCKSLEFGWEVSGIPDKDILVGPLPFAAWTEPAGEAISEERQLELLAQFRRWLAAQKTRSDIDLPAVPIEGPRKCIWYGCDKQTLRNSPYCRHHFDLTCLKR